MKVLIGGEKGGSGKSTIATSLAAMRKRMTDNDVLLIDADIQQSANYWTSIRESDLDLPQITCVSKSGKLNKTIDTLAEKYDDIIIDAGGRDSEELRSASLSVDKIITPIRPSQFDVWTLDKASSLFEVSKMYNEKLKAYLVLNGVNASSMSTDVKMAQELILSEFEDLTLLHTIICDRVCYRRVVRDGRCVLEANEKDAKANSEMKSLYNEVFDD